MRCCDATWNWESGRCPNFALMNLRQPITFTCRCLRMGRDWLYVRSCFMTQFIFVCLWLKTAKSLHGISRLSRKSAMRSSMLAYNFLACTSWLLLIQCGETCLLALTSGLVWRNVQRTIPPIVSMSFDFDPMWEKITCQTDDTERFVPILTQRGKKSHAEHWHWSGDQKKAGPRWCRMTVPGLQSFHALWHFTFCNYSNKTFPFVSSRESVTCFDVSTQHHEGQQCNTGDPATLRSAKWRSAVTPYVNA